MQGAMVMILARSEYLLIDDNTKMHSSLKRFGDFKRNYYACFRGMEAAL